jgi:LacI family transcriptional regulator
VASLTAPDACLRGVARYARQQGWHVVTDMLFTGTFPRGWKGDGIIALAAYQTDLIRHIHASGTPCVSIAISDEPLSFASVRGDQVAVGRMAAEHLLERAYRNFAWAPFIGDQINRDRFRGFETHLVEQGCTCQVLPTMHQRIGDYWHDDWGRYRRTLLAGLTKLPRPTAVFAANDCVAAEIIDACYELNIAVPEEVAVLGVGNDERLCEAASVPISSVALDLEEMAYRAAAALDEIMRGGAVPDALVVSPKRVVTRLSTDNRAVGNSQVARALSYIAEHFHERTLSAVEVVTAIGISRRQLERSFRTETGCTVHDLIIKRRMQEASRLLRTYPRAKIGDIADLVGFEGSGAFFRTFRRFYGEGPQAHRLGKVHAGVAAVPGEPTRESA